MPYYDESQSDRFSRKVRESPLMVVGMVGLLGVVGYSIYGYRNRKVKTSLYIIHTRVMAQGFVVTCLTVGVSYNLFNKFIASKFAPASIESSEKKE